MEPGVIIQIAVSGALMGLVYALVAYGFQLTYATSKSINFGQGELVMISAFFSLTLTGWGLPYLLMVPGGLAFGAVLGLFVERAGVRLALEQKSEGWILLTIILGLLGFSSAENIWGRDDRPFPTPISADPLTLLGVQVTPLEISVAVGVLAIMGLIELFKRQTLLGKAFEAVSADRDAAELMGISATGTVMLSYALSGAVAAVAGILVSPTRFGLRRRPGRPVPRRPGRPGQLLSGQRLARGARPDPADPGAGRPPDRRVRQDGHPQGMNQPNVRQARRCTNGRC